MSSCWKALFVKGIMSSMKSSVVLIANPIAQRASEHKIQRAIKLLRSAGYEVCLYLTEKKGDAEDYARKASGNGASFIIAAGGDGTFNEVMNGLVNTATKMAILPMGTTNVLAKELSVPEDVGGAIYRALNGDVHAVSLGKISVTHHSSLITRHFSLMAGIGFDGEAVQSVNETLKRYSGKGAYILSGLKTLLRYCPEELRFIINGKTYSGYSAIIGKASKYGGYFKITPDAALHDPHLYLYIMHGGKRRDILRYFYGLLMGSHLKLKDVTYRRADSIRVEGTAHIQVDGDYLGTTPAMITVVPGALRLIY